MKPPRSAVDEYGMSAAAKPSHEYLKAAVAGATPEQLQVMLFDGAIRFALRGRDALAAKDYEGAFNNLDRAQRIVLEIIAGINRDANPTVADTMLALYDFAYRRLVEALMARQPEAIDEAVNVLRHQRETWAIIVEKVARDAPTHAARSTPSPAAPHDQAESTLSVQV